MKIPAAFTRADNALRAHALKYPDSYEEFPWGHRAIKINGKAFVFIAVEGTRFSMSVKLPGSNLAALMLPFAAPTAYGMGKSGWVTATFGPKDKIPLDILESWIDESFRAIAPKTLLKRMAAESSGAPAKKTPKAKAASARGRKTE
ncbi:MAG: MmcQ/YjbR family DNA-binding protein [Acidobacteria bacterium]|nr:MmcQ/YjbR family DNA-binding protein [Acidobacteriota bacterium]